MKRLSARPHHLGSAYDKENAEFIASLFKSWGYDTNIEHFDVLFPTPKTRVVELIAPERYTAKLAEPALAGGRDVEPDRRAAADLQRLLDRRRRHRRAGLRQLRHARRTTRCWSATASTCKGKIVIARYGGSWRGIKPKVAAEHGAIGCLIYSDPRDDGYFAGRRLSEGRVPQRARRAARLGGRHAAPSGRSADARHRRHRGREAARSQRRDDASRRSRCCRSPTATRCRCCARWPVRSRRRTGAARFRSPITSAPGPARVHLKLEFDWKIVPATTSSRGCPARDLADEWIMRGNHHDALGATAPTIRSAAWWRCWRKRAPSASWRRAAGVRGGRSIFAAWDGEEQGLLGSTEWVETHAAELQRARRGLHQLRLERPRLPRRRRLAHAGALRERGRARRHRSAAATSRSWSACARHDLVERRVRGRPKELRDRTRLAPRRARLRLGLHAVPAAPRHRRAEHRLRRRGRSTASITPSTTRSITTLRFGDPNFDYGIAQAKTTGRMVLRLANADVLPFEASTSRRHGRALPRRVTKLADKMRARDRRSRTAVARAHDASSPPIRRSRSSRRRPRRRAVPRLAPLQNAVARLQKSAKAFDARSTTRRSHRHAPRARAHAASEGLPGRPWYKHHVYAPGFYTGYGVKTLPGVREAIEQRKWADANAQIVILAGVLERYAEMLER